jgi:hypothetical protein
LDPVETEHAIFERLERIEGLRREEAPAGALLDEVRALLSEAEDWVRSEPGLPPGVAATLERAQARLEAGEQSTARALISR